MPVTVARLSAVVAAYMLVTRTNIRCRSMPGHAQVSWQFITSPAASIHGWLASPAKVGPNAQVSGVVNLSVRNSKRPPDSLIIDAKLLVIDNYTTCLRAAFPNAICDMTSSGKLYKQRKYLAKVLL